MATSCQCACMLPMQHRDEAQRRAEHDHPSVDRTAAPARTDEILSNLSAEQREALERGQGVDLSSLGDDIMANLKVFQDQDNQLGLSQLIQVPVSCLECGAEGTHKSSQVTIPNFAVTELSSFSCGECGFRYNNTRVVDALIIGGRDELPAGHGRKTRLLVETAQDLQREAVLSDGAFLFCPDMELEVFVTNGMLSTVEGLLRGLIGKLNATSILVDTDDGEGAAQLGYILNARVDTLVSNVKEGRSFEIIIQDPSDSSIFQSRGESDTNLVISTYPLEEEEEEQEQEQIVQSCGLGQLAPGAKVQAFYLDKWLEDCVVVDVLSSGTIQVQESKDPPGVNTWFATRDEIRGCDQPGCPCQTPTPVDEEDSGQNDRNTGNEMSDKDLMDYLNNFADHVQAQEGHLTDLQKRRANEQQAKKIQEQRALADLESMD